MLVDKFSEMKIEKKDSDVKTRSNSDIVGANTDLKQRQKPKYTEFSYLLQ